MTENVIDLIRKCLALTKSNQPGEAANAAAMVQKLLFKHHLTMADISTKEESPIKDQELDLNPLRHEGKWRKQLIYCIARYNFCKMIGSYDDLRAFVIGTKNDTEAVIEIYQWVAEQLIREEKVANICRNKTYRRSFFTGAVIEISNRLYHQWESLRKESSASTALVVHNEEALVAYVEKRFGELRKGRHCGSSGSHSGYMDGRAAGARVSISRPTRPLTGG